jgi:hypothetical protein
MHEIEVGKIALVATKLPKHQFNARRVEKAQNLGPECFSPLTHHIPHTTYVLVIDVYIRHYLILWNENLYLISYQYLINPYYDETLHIG